MYYSPALLLSLLQLCTMAKAAPLSVEAVKMKSSQVKWRAEQLLVKINNNFKIPIAVTRNPPSEQYGLNSIVTNLKRYNSRISERFDHASQVKAEIASLVSVVDEWRQSNCIERQKTTVPEQISPYTHTVTFRSLFEVKEYLKNLLNNLDQLDTCT